MKRIWSAIKKREARSLAAVAVISLAPLVLTQTAASGPLANPDPLESRAGELQPPLRIIAFGSSSTEGRGATNAAATYPAQLQGLLSGMLPNGRKVEVINRGIGGEDADDMLRRLRRDVIARRPNLVIWQTGSNDPVRHVPIERFEQETREGIALMQAAGINVILMEPQWCPTLEKIADSHEYRDAVRRVGDERNVEVIRRSDLMHNWIREGMLTRQEMLASDGMHMTDGGYALLARSAAREVMQVEDIRPITRTSTVTP